MRSAPGAVNRVGLAVAVGVATVFVAVLAILMMGHSARRAASGQSAGPALAGEAPPDVPLLGSRAGDGGAGNAGNVVRTRGMAVQIADRRDPARLAGEIISASLDPEGAARYAVERPEAWLFLRDGRTVHVRADDGVLFMPDRQREPDSGTLRGDVVISMFGPREPREGGGGGGGAGSPGARPDPARDTPAWRVRTARIDFDLTVGEAVTGERVEAWSPALRFAGRGLRLLFSQEAQRLEFLRVEEGEEIVVLPEGASAEAVGPAARGSRDGAGLAAREHAGVGTEHGAAVIPAAWTPGAPAVAGGVQSAAGRETAAPEVFYHAVFAREVRVEERAGAGAGAAGGESAGGRVRRTIESDGLEAFARVVDNALAPNAFGEVEEATPKSGGAPAPAGASEARAEGPAPGAGPAAAPSAVGESAAADAAATEGREARGPVRITWDGPLEVRPVATRPIELEQDEVALRFVSRADGRHGGLVRFADVGDARGSDAAAGEADGQAASRGARGEAPVIEYFATRRRVALLESADTPPDVPPDVPATDGTPALRVALELDGAGRGAFERLIIDTPSGVASAPSAGWLRAAERDAEGGSGAEPARVAWSDGATFLFNARGGRMTGALREAVLQGGVRATDGDAELSGGALRAVFDAERDPGANSSRLARLSVRDAARAVDGRGDAIEADEIDVAFAPPADRPEASPSPRVATARGGVRASRGGQRLEAALLEATFDDPPARSAEAGAEAQGEGAAGLAGLDGAQVRAVTASGGVRYEDRDGVLAVGDRLEADAPAQRALLLGAEGGEPARVTRADTMIESHAIALDQRERRVETPGAGVFRHRPTVVAADAGPGAGAAGDDAAREADVDGALAWAGPMQPGHVAARWWTSMTFDDLRGVVTLTGDAEAVSTPGPLTRDTVHGERVVLTLDPAPVQALDALGAPALPVFAAATLEGVAVSRGPDLVPEFTEEPERRLRRAHVEGDPAAGPEARERRARVESRTYAAAAARAGTSPAATGASDVPPRVLERVAFLEAPSIDADATAGVIDAPGPGRLLLVDRRANDGAGNNTGTGAGAGGGAGANAPTASMSRGDALLTFNESLRANRDTGLVTLAGRARLTHVRLGDRALTEVEGDTLEAMVRFAGERAPGAAATPAAGSGLGLPEGGELTRAIARGAVWARSGSREATADELQYDAAGGTARLTGSGPGMVTIIDAGTGTPLTARVILWDMLRDTVRVEQPGTITSPR